MRIPLSQTEKLWLVFVLRRGGRLTERIRVGGLEVDSALYHFVSEEALPGTGVDALCFWAGLEDLIETMAPRNRDLLAHRADLQRRIDLWHMERRGRPHDLPAYRSFLEGIGYISPEGPDFEIDTKDVDPEIALIAGPQLVVPVTNARYVINAANARWGSLYDALYGTDALGDAAVAGPYDTQRGERVIAWVRNFLDNVIPLRSGTHASTSAYRVERAGLKIEQLDGSTTTLDDPRLFVGYLGDPHQPRSVMFRHHGLHIELVLDRSHSVGAIDPAGIADVVIESAVTTIVDLEDSVAIVDTDDKVLAYRNWLGLIRGDLEVTFGKGNATITRQLAGDHELLTPDHRPASLPGRALLLIRNVGHLMTTDAILDRDGSEIPEGVLDALVTTLIALHDLRRGSAARHFRAGSVYIVKPKMHGPDEVAFAVDLLAEVEGILGLAPNTVKIGLMDEERRTTLNLKECIRAARSRIAFINTGFLDRTGDEIHTSMQAGRVVRKADMRTQPWLAAYEKNNVDVGLQCGLHHRAQIGKGMWAAPDLMAEMLRQKIAHPQAGANCAWVPSPTAATLHATHYHLVDVFSQQLDLIGRRRASIDDLLALPLIDGPPLGADEIMEELENNAQGILGYVVRWVDRGVGCSKVPDIHDVALMEDRATCRISAQHIANWLLHGVVNREEVEAIFRRVAATVDRQNSQDAGYTSMGPGFDGPSFRAALALALAGTAQPSGYTEPILTARRRERKAGLS